MRSGVRALNLMSVRRPSRPLGDPDAPYTIGLTATLALGLTVLSAPAHATADSEIILINRLTGKCVTVAGGTSTENNVGLVQYECDKHPSRRWTLDMPFGTTQYWLRNVQTGKCATVAGGELDWNNLDLVQYNCDYNMSRTWAFWPDASGAYQIRNQKTLKCMTLAGGTSTENNVGLVQYDCDSHRSRQWYMHVVTG
jgi:cytolethal distending toxin subunit A